MSDKKPIYLPAFGPDDCLWLVTVTGQWPVYCHTSESSAMYDARKLQDAEPTWDLKCRVRVTKVTIADYQALEYQRETVREALIPVGEPS